MRLGAYILRPPSALEAVRRFQCEEANGYDSVYATHVNGCDAPTLLGAAAVETKHVKVGVGVVPIYTRTPTTMAMTAATLWELSKGRAMLGLGTGHRIRMERWHGDAMMQPLIDMREYIGILRSILSGHPQPRTGKWASDMLFNGVSTAPEMRLMIGALGPAMLRLAGEIADGVMVWLATPSYFADIVIPMAREGRERAGKPMAGFEIVASIPCAVTKEVHRTRSVYAKQIAHNLRLPFYRSLLSRGGYVNELTLVDEADSHDALEASLPSDIAEGLARGRFVAEIAAIGDDHAIADTMLQYRNAGVTMAGINPIRIDQFDSTIEAAARAFTILPHA